MIKTVSGFSPQYCWILWRDWIIVKMSSNTRQELSHRLSPSCLISECWSFLHPQTKPTHQGMLLGFSSNNYRRFLCCLPYPSDWLTDHLFRCWEDRGLFVWFWPSAWKKLITEKAERKRRILDSRYCPSRSHEGEYPAQISPGWFGKRVQ